MQARAPSRCIHVLFVDESVHVGSEGLMREPWKTTLQAQEPELYERPCTVAADPGTMSDAVL